MIQDSTSSRSKINNELAARAANQRAQQVIEHHTPDNELDGLKIDFYCECSNADCTARIPLTLEQFKEMHAEQSHFVIAKGHATPAIEKVIKTKGSMQIVSKYML